MDISQIITIAGTLGAGAILKSAFDYLTSRHNKKAEAAKTMAEREEVYSRISIAQIKAANEQTDKAWEIADRIDEDLKEAREDVKRLQGELNNLREKLVEKEREINTLKSQLKQFQPHGRPPRNPEG